MTTEMLLPAAFFAGFFGSGHCFGMCGPVVVLLEGGQPTSGALARRLAYNVGRMIFYVVLGLVAGTAGIVLTQVGSAEQALQLMRLVASLLVILIGLNLLLDLRTLQFLESAGTGVWRHLSKLAKHVLPATTVPRALAAGFVWGSLPCGLVYSAVAMAAISAGTAEGGAVMLAFWLGTLPALLVAGSAADRLAGFRRSSLIRRAAGLLLVFIGLAPLLISAGRHH